MSSFWTWLERLFETQDDPLPIAVDAIVGVGCDVSADGTACSPMSAAVAERVDDLYATGKAPRVIFTGGYRIPKNDYDHPSEAGHMFNLVKHSIPGQAICLETCGVRTYLNADYTLRILRKHGCRSAIVVAQQWHARRVRATFQKRWAGQGITIYMVKARSPYGNCSQWRLRSFPLFVIWDTLAYFYGKIRGYN